MVLEYIRYIFDVESLILIKYTLVVVCVCVCVCVCVERGLWIKG